MKAEIRHHVFVVVVVVGNVPTVGQIKINLIFMLLLLMMMKTKNTISTESS